MALGGFASRVLVSPGKMIIIMLGGFRFVISEWTKQSLSPSRDELGRDNVDVFYHKDEDENFGNPEEVTIIPFFERMLRRIIKTDPGKPCICNMLHVTVHSYCTAQSISGSVRVQT